MKYFNKEPILSMVFHKETGLWIIITAYSTYRIKPEVVEKLLKEGVLHE